MKEFSRIKRLPPYVFNITAELKMAARRRGEDIIDMSMGNPDGPTPQHIVDKLVEAVKRPDTHGYSVSKGIPRLRRAIRPPICARSAWKSCAPCTLCSFSDCTCTSNARFIGAPSATALA